MKTAKYFEDYEIGESFESPGRTITETHLILHAGNTGDMHELQMNEEYASRTTFGKRLVHAPLTYSIMEGLINSNPLLRSANICYYGLDRMRMPNPVFIGDTIKVKRAVVEKRVKDQRGGIVKFVDEVINQRNEIVMICESLEYIRLK